MNEDTLSYEEESLISEIEIPEFYNKHYITLDSQNNIIDGWSNGPHPSKDTSKAICINEQGGYQFTINGVENPPIINMEGLFLYKYEDEQIKEKTPSELRVEKTLLQNKNIHLYQEQAIKESKQKLEEHLRTHPYTWTDGNQYSVTQEKQALLTSQLTLYAMDPKINLHWNATGQECKTWSITSLTSLAKGISNYVNPLVTYQQRKELEILACETIDELNSVVVDYETLE